MELMGYDYLTLDQDKVAKDIAKERGMDWTSISTAALPAVSGEDPLPDPLPGSFSARHPCVMCDIDYPR